MFCLGKYCEVVHTVLSRKCLMDSKCLENANVAKHLSVVRAYFVYIIVWFRDKWPQITELSQLCMKKYCIIY